MFLLNLFNMVLVILIDDFLGFDNVNNDGQIGDDGDVGTLR